MSVTIEQEAQTAIKGALSAALTAASLTARIHAQKLDTVEYSGETFPVIVLATSTPVPQGHKSKMIDIPLWVSVMAYIADDPALATFAKLTDAVFQALHVTSDWSTFTPFDNVTDISSVLITVGEEATINGDVIEQRTQAIIAVRYKEQL